MNASGAIIKDKLFVFGGYEHLQRGLPTPNTIAPARRGGHRDSRNPAGCRASVQHAQFLNLRLDWNINRKHQVFVRYNYFRNEYPFNTAVGGKNALDAASDFHDRAHVGGSQVLTTFSPTVLNELRASEPYRNEAHVPSPGRWPWSDIVDHGAIATLSTATRPQFLGDSFAEKIPSLSDNFT